VVWTSAEYSTFLSWVMVGMEGLRQKNARWGISDSFGCDSQMGLPNEISASFKVTRWAIALEFIIARLPEQ
jgi:hypothetical protein